MMPILLPDNLWLLNRENRMKSHGTEIVSEWDENVLFDADDPDFECTTNAAGLPNVVLQHNPLANATHVPAHIPILFTG